MTFHNHQLRYKSETRWLLFEKEGNSWKQEGWAEISSMEGGLLYVGGAIQHCIFGQYLDSQDPLAKINWLGSHKTFDEFIIERAKIGMECEVERPRIKRAHQAVCRLLSLLPATDSTLHSLSLRISTQTLEDLKAVGEMTQSQGLADIISYSVGVARVVTSAVKIGNDVIFERDGERNKLYLTGLTT